MPTIRATPGAADANSYETLAEANAYFDERIPLVPPWIASGDLSIQSLITATRVLDSMSQPYRYFVVCKDACGGGYYRTRRQWTGIPSTTTQRLAWPRIGMFDRNGNPIPADVIPQELKDAESELAGQLQQGDRTLDNTVVSQGIKSVSAGSVSVTFKDDITVQVLPDAVMNLLPPSWFTDELISMANSEWEFEVI